MCRTQTVENAKAEAEKIRLIGESEAKTLDIIGTAEAERMRLKAQVYKKYNEAAILNIALNAMPKVIFLSLIIPGVTRLLKYLFVILFNRLPLK